MNGILLIDKPKGMTSRDVVNTISKIFKTKKVGHAGTLDPIATGVLVICIGTYTKLVPYLTNHEKEYIATMRLGLLTDTLDITGKVIDIKKTNLNKKRALKIIANFPKKYFQEVPKYSAVKINGKKLYEYARENKEIQLPKREVYIRNLKVLKINNNEISFKTTVSKGTYIRSLIKDIATVLDTYACMSELRRTKQGNFKIEDCHQLKDVCQSTSLLTVENIFSYKTYELNEEELKKVNNGNMLNINSNEENLFVTYQNKIIAIYQKNENNYKITFKL